MVSSVKRSSLAALISLLTSIAITISIIANKGFLLPLSSLDQLYYMRVGKGYIEGKPPVSINYEHPPLAKYFIGFCWLYGCGYCCSLLAIGVSALMYLSMARRFSLGLSSYYAIFLSLFFLFEPVILSLGFHGLLDTFMLPLVMLTLYSYLRYVESCRLRWLLVFGVSLGAMFATKLIALYFVLGILFDYFMRLGSRWGKYSGLLSIGFYKLLLVIAISFSVYGSAFVMDFASGGIQLFIRHQVMMASYLVWRHSYSLPLALNGVTNYFFHFEVWGYGGSYVVHLSNSTVSWVEYRAPIHKTIMLKFTPYLSNIFLPLATALALSSPMLLDEKRRPIALVHLSSLLMLLHGPIWWYYMLPIVTAYLVFAAYPWRKPRIALTILGAGLLAAWSSYAALLLLGHPSPLVLTVEAGS